MMEYKGYVAKVEYDDSIGMLHGSVINSGDYPIATCEAKDVDTLRREFRLSIDDYLTTCKESGIAPREPLSGTLHLRLGPELHQRVSISAARNGMSIDSWITEVLDEAAARR